MVRPGSSATLVLSTVFYVGCIVANSRDAVHVAPATGQRQADRASILAALEQVKPGGTVQFAAGTYVVGEILRVRVPRVTLVGHRAGTTIRGCDPSEFVDRDVALFACHGFGLEAGHQTVRNLTFEYVWHGVFVGCCFPSDMDALRAGPPQRSQIGGHVIEGNTFRNSPNGMRVFGESAEATVIRDNEFVNTYHAVIINGGSAHVLDNRTSVPEPEAVPITRFPGSAFAISPYGYVPGDSAATDHTSCARNVIAGNRIEGHPDGIRIALELPGTSCRQNVIRDNTIAVRRARCDSTCEGYRLDKESDSTFVGVPIALQNWVAAYPERFGGVAESSKPGVIEDNLIDGNRVHGAEGLGIELLHASRNLVVKNTVRGVIRRAPLPGNTLDVRGGHGDPLAWRDANGTGIWVSPGSTGNAILDNTFADIAVHAVVLEGNGNRVEVRSKRESVRDVGTGNRVRRR